LLSGRLKRHYVMGMVLLCVLMCCECAFGLPRLHAQGTAFDHTAPALDETCNQAYYSPDGNPFQLCPGPYPGGGNCVWWAWEQWHLLGYTLPLNWGNAADWIVDAERTGLPLGEVPRVGSIAVFPVADGVWAFGPAGHVALVTWVSADGRTFDVTYQNYGDPTPMYTGVGYPVQVINEPRYQDGELRFIYFPLPIDPNRFAQLPGVNGSGLSEVIQAKRALATGSTLASNQAPAITLGLPQGSSEQAFDADFAGNGLSDLLLYTRAQGRLDVLNLSSPALPKRHFPLLVYDEIRADPTTLITPQRVSLADATTPAGGWGSALDIRIGDFTGSGQSEILLSDRVTGQIQLLVLTPQLRIKQHITLPGWGPGWEVYVGRFDGQRSALFLYNRSVDATLLSSPTTSSTPGPTASPTPDPTTSPKTRPTPIPSPRPTASPTPNPTPSPTPNPTPSPTPNPTPNPTPSPTPNPTPDPTPSPTPSPTPNPTSSPTPGPTPSPTPNPTPSPTANPTPSPTPGPTPSPTASPTPSPTAHPTPRPTVSPTPSPTPTRSPAPGPTATVPGGNPGGGPETQAAPANVLVVDFTRDLSVRHVQPYTLSQNSWEVYVGRFVNPGQDGIFLYDRTSGEARIMSFTSALLLAHSQELHTLAGNWEVHSGDFAGSGQAQVLLYDPGTGDAHFLVFARDLSLAAQKRYAGWGKNLVLYPGHFGSPAPGIMLYDPAAQQSTFLAFDARLQITLHSAVPSWDQHWQLLVGAFLDRSRCLARGNCTTGDDILLLDRRTGEMQQYIFSFGPRFKVYDNRLQAFLREGAAAEARLIAVGAPSFSVLATLETTITVEELY
jgi:hypothetical protein